MTDKAPVEAPPRESFQIAADEATKDHLHHAIVATHVDEDGKTAAQRPAAPAPDVHAEG